MYNATDYILSGLFLQDIEKNHFQTIIFETKEKLIFENISSYPITSLYELGLDFTKQGKLMQHINKHKNALLILDKLNIDIFKDVLSNSKTNLTVVNCNAGISSIGKKLQIEINDIFEDIAFSNLFEPFDITSLIFSLQCKNAGLTYIRVANKDYVDSIIQNDKGKKNTGNKTTKKQTKNSSGIFFGETKKEILPIIDLTTMLKTSTKSIASIVCGGSMIPTTIQACTILENKKIETDIFVVFDWQILKKQQKKEITKFYESFLKHISTTKKLIIICDCEENKNLKTMRKTFLNYHKIQAEIFFITPEITNITTILSDYIYEQAQFDGNIIAQKIEKILNHH